MIIANSHIDTLAPRERVREIGAILASGYLRARAANTAPTKATVTGDAPGPPQNLLRNDLDEVTANDPSCPPSSTARDSRGAAAHGEHR